MARLSESDSILAAARALREPPRKPSAPRLTMNNALRLAASEESMVGCTTDFIGHALDVLREVPQTVEVQKARANLRHHLAERFL